jgi:hypothetical protein
MRHECCWRCSVGNELVMKGDGGGWFRKKCSSS